MRHRPGAPDGCTQRRLPSDTVPALRTLRACNTIVRMRPQAGAQAGKHETAGGSPWRIDGNTIYQARGRPDDEFTLDHVFGPEASTAQLYKGSSTRSKAADVVKGINCTLMAYGQTCSGKTFTMHGHDDKPGLIASTVGDVFELTDSMPGTKLSMSMSYPEVRGGILHGERLACRKLACSMQLRCTMQRARAEHCFLMHVAADTPFRQLAALERLLAVPCSCIQLYKEDMVDLLNPDKKLKI